MASHCYAPQKGIDDVIANNVKGWNPYIAATIRGVYDELHPGNPINITPENINESIKVLQEFAKSRVNARISEINSVSKNIGEEIIKFQEKFSARTRMDRINLITTTFSSAVTAVQKAIPNLSREQIIKGFIDGKGDYVGGQFKLFEFVYNDLLKKYSEFSMQADNAKENQTKEDFQYKANEIAKVLDFWPVFVTLARVKLRDTEGLKLNNQFNHVSETVIDDFLDDSLEELYIAEEAPRESYQLIKERISAFSTLSKEVRVILSNLNNSDENGFTDKDDLEVPRKVDPIKAFQTLVGIGYGSINHETFMKKLDKYAEHSNSMWIRQLSNLLFVNPNWKSLSTKEKANNIRVKQLRSKFFHEVNKVFQSYSQIIFTTEKGIVKSKTKILNRPNTNALYSGFMMRILSKTPIIGSKSLFDKNGKVNWENVQEYKNIVETNMPLATEDDVFADTKKPFNNLTSVEKRKMLLELLNSLGIDVHTSTIDMLLTSKKSTSQLLNLLSELSYYGINSILNNSEKKLLSQGLYSEVKSMNYVDFINTHIGNARESIIEEKIIKILKLLDKYSNNLKLEPKVRAMAKNGKKSTYHSLVEPSFMGTFFKRISYFASESISKGLQSYLENKYFSSSFFKEGNIIYNYWLRELYNSDLNNPESFANNLDFVRGLGQAQNSKEIAFEDISDKAHMLEVMQYYFSLRQQNKKSKYALYPTFILGDSGNTRYITAPRLNVTSLMEEFYNVYKQEHNRMALSKAFREKLIKDGLENTGSAYSSNKNLENYETQYTYLQFLNSNFVSPDGTVGKYSKLLGDNPTQQEFNNALNTYMGDQIQNFKTTQLIPMGLLDTVTFKEGGKEISRFKYFSQDVAENKTIDNVIADFFWNYKFATIQQLQVLSIDPAFFKNSKEFQKRNKASNANKLELDIEAIDYDGNYYLGEREFNSQNNTTKTGPNNIMRTVYFKDIKVNGENVAKEFMDALLYNHFDSKFTTLEEVKEALDEGITIPLKDKIQEAERIKKIQKMMGENWDTYKAYTDNTLTDGAGWRTLSSYRKVMGASKNNWTNEMENAYNIIQSIRKKYKNTNETLSKEDLKTITELSVIFKPIKPLFYGFEKYGINESDNLLIPVQLKYAEILAIPELYPAGSALREMMLWAEDNEVDVIASTEAVKSGEFGSVDITDMNNNSSLSDVLNKAYVHKLDYQDYGIQTNVPDHINEHSLFGTQLRKAILLHIDKAKDYSHYLKGRIPQLYRNSKNKKFTGETLISFYNALIVSNVVESLNEVQKIFGSTQNLSKLFIQNVINNNRNGIDSLIAYSLTQDEKFIIPLFEGVMEDETMRFMLSIFKKNVNNQRIKGGSAVQASGMGIHESKIDGGLKYVSDQQGNIIYAETVMPFNLSITDINGKEIFLNYDDYVNSDGSLKQTKSNENLIETHYPGILDMIVYRIPTEGLYSMMNLKIVRFLPKLENGTIRVPALGTTNMGFDFDIDKLYFMRKEFSKLPVGDSMNQELWEDFYSENDAIYQHLLETRRKSPNKYSKLYEYWEESSLSGTYQNAIDDYFKKNAFKYVKFEQYDFDKIPYYNTRVARNNMIFELIQARLSDPETAKERTTVGGFNNARKAGRFMRELIFGNINSLEKATKSIKGIESIIDPEIDPEPNYDVTEPTTLITYNKLNQIASKLIGIFANHNTNHAYSSIMNTFAVATPIKFGSHSINGLSDLKNINNNALTQIHELLSSSVDAVKDPVLNYLNLNIFTADSGALLTRLGYDFEEIGLLFNQPIIKEIVLYGEREGVTISDAIDTIQRRLHSKIYGITSESIDLQIDTETDFNIESLINGIINGRKEGSLQTKESNIQQLKILSLFSQIVSTASELTNFVNVTKFTASNAVPSTIGGLYSQQMRVQGYIEKLNNSKRPLLKIEVSENVHTPINTSSELLNLSDESYIESLTDNKFAIEQVMYDSNRKVLKAIEKLTPYGNRAYVEIREFLKTLSRYDHLDEKSIDSAHKELPVYVLSQMIDTPFHGQSMYDASKNLTNRDYYTKIFPQELYELVQSNPNLEKLQLFQKLEFGITESETDSGVVQNSYIRLNNVAIESYMKDNFKDDWATLDPQLAENLFMYNFYTLGFNFGHTSFMHLMPNNLKLKLQSNKNWGMSYIEFYEALKDGSLDFLINTEDFAKQYILNHTDNYRFTYTLKNEALREVAKLYIKDGIVQDRFELDISKNKMSSKIASEFLLPNNENEDEYAFKPLLIINNHLYMPQGNGMRFNYNYGPVMTYVRVQQQGITNISLQYNGTHEKVLNNLQEPIEIPIPSNEEITEFQPSLSIPSETEIFSNIEDAIRAQIEVELVNKTLTEEQVKIRTQVLNKVFNEQSTSEIEMIMNKIKQNVRENGLIDQITNKIGC